MGLKIAVLGAGNIGGTLLAGARSRAWECRKQPNRTWNPVVSPLLVCHLEQKKID